MTRPTLAISIPTYCRPQQIALNFAGFMQEAADLGVLIYISDDSPDDETERLTRTVRQSYGNVIYRRNTPSLGHDQNVMQSLLWPDTDYVWVMGDAFRTATGGLAAVLDILTGQDFEFVNRNGLDFRLVGPCSGEEAINLIRNLIWHQTLTGGTIYHRRVREWVRKSDLTIHSNFPHLDVILGYATIHNTSIGWFGRPILESAPKNQSYWHHRAFDVFVDDWASVILAHRAILCSNRIASILKSHSSNTRLFNIEFMLHLRDIGHFNWSSTRRLYFWDVMHLPRAIIIAILLIPKYLIPHTLIAKRTAGRITKWLRAR